MHMTHMQDNVVQHLLNALQVLETHAQTLNNMPHNTVDKANAKHAHMQDMLEEINILLCNLVSVMVTAPITGRMFIPLPQSKTTARAAEESMHMQLHGRAT